MPEMHLRQSGFTYSVCGPFTNYFQHDMAYRDFKDFKLEQLLLKYCMIKHLILLKIQNMMDIKVDFLQWSTNFLIKNFWQWY